MIAVDLYFLMNASYDLTLLAVTGIAARKKLSIGRVFAAALLGALWSCISLCFAVSFEAALWQRLFGKLITYFVCPCLMCRIAYKNDGRLRESMLYFYGIGALTGGFMFLLRRMGLKIPSWISMPVCAVSSVGLWLYLGKKEHDKQRLYEAKLIYHGKTVCTMALYDSGNTLATAKKEPVHVLAPSVWTELVGTDKWQEEGCFPIAYQTVTEASVMPVIYLDFLFVKKDPNEAPLVFEKAAAGLGSMELGGPGNCRMLLNSAVFN